MKLVWKLSLGVGLLVLLSTAVVGALVARWIEQDALAETRRDLEDKAFFLQDMVRREHGLERDLGELQAAVRGLGAGAGTRFTIVDPRGKVLADSHEEPARMNDHARRPEILQAAAEGVGSATRFSETLGTRMMYVALQVGEAPAPLGYARAALPLAEVDRRLGQARRVVFLGALVGLGIALVPGLMFARYVSGPLQDMRNAAQALAAGQGSTDLPVRSRDELGDLAEAFNAMAGQLRERMATIDTDRNKLLAILSSMVEGVVAVDRKEQVVHMNRVAAKLLGADFDASIGRPMRDVIGVEGVCQLLERTLEVPEESSEEVSLEGLRDRTLRLQASPLRAADGTVAGALVVMLDVSQLVRLEAIRRTFVANVSHELKTPLTAIRALVETLLDDEGMEAEQRRRFLDKAAKQAERLSTLVSDLLVLSRIESKDAGLERERFDLRGPVGESARGLRGVADEKQLHLAEALPGEPILVVGDREYMRQIVDNLLSNALMYTPAGKDVRLALSREGDHAVLEVVDEGIGIAPEQQTRIFQRFYRVDKGRSRTLGGTGLGLAIVKHLVLAHRGRIEVESALGEGSTFRVTLPLANGKSA